MQRGTPLTPSRNKQKRRQKLAASGRPSLFWWGDGFLDLLIPKWREAWKGPSSPRTSIFVCAGRSLLFLTEVFSHQA
ncbi:hypothetical protein IQ17_06523 [Bradyrhizobium daqingense]|uniref:Uncharacterized protein n=1 Tax=Bradyrhizobium daqingense TaxID=993502 RepID=A0A562KKH8_9BRAD|nr:hypothetical protein IQ17_06523 [Bradyrhizobium daqingense]